MAFRALGPATLQAVQAVEQTLVVDDRTLLVACSGGPDSLALVVASSVAARRRSLGICGVVVDHGLQQHSDRIAAEVAAVSARLGVPTDVVRVAVPPSGAGLEADARTARYAALEQAAEARGATVLLGHTLDDQAETVLLGLARGSGTRSLSGMAVRREPLVRPFLGLRRATIRSVCAENGLTPWSDPHNQDLSFTRVRMRDRVLPQLEAELGPGVAEALARTAQLLRDDADLLDRLAVDAEAGAEPDCEQLAGLPAALRRRVLRDWLRSCGARDLGARHLAAVEKLVTDWRGQRWVEVPGLAVRRVHGRLTCRPDLGD